jgi:hypothetical protein
MALRRLTILENHSDSQQNRSDGSADQHLFPT